MLDMSDVYHESAYYDDYPAITEDIANYFSKEKNKNGWSRYV